MFAKHTNCVSDDAATRRRVGSAALLLSAKRIREKYANRNKNTYVCAYILQMYVRVKITKQKHTDRRSLSFTAMAAADRDGRQLCALQLDFENEMLRERQNDFADLCVRERGSKRASK